MKYNKDNWVHRTALEHCLLDPRFDKDLRMCIVQHMIDTDATSPQKKLFGSGANFNEKDVLVVGRMDLAKSTANYFAMGDTLEEKIAVKNALNVWRLTLEKSVKDAVTNGILTNQPDFKDILDFLKEAALNYYNKIVESWTHRVQQILESLSNSTIEKNNSFSCTEELANRTRLASRRVSEEVTNFEKQSITITESGIKAFLTTGIGREKKSSFNATLAYQEDRAGVLSDFKLHPSWQNRINELLALTVQELAIETYKTIPRYNWSEDVCEIEKFNSSFVGSTLTILLRLSGKLHIIFLGDSPVAYLQIHKSTRKAKANLLTWSHHPGQKSEAQCLELQRVKQEDGKISGDRVTSLYGAIAVSRAVGDLGALGISDIGSIVCFDKDKDPVYQNFLFLGSDGVFDYLPLNQIEELSRYIAPECLSECFCNESFKDSCNQDNITGLLIPDGCDVFAYVADGHNGSCIVEHIYKNINGIFRKLAENAAPNEIFDQEIEEVKAKKLRTEHEGATNLSKNDMLLSQLFFNPVLNQKEIDFIRNPYNRDNIITKICNMPNFYDENHCKEELERKLLENKCEFPFFIIKSPHLSEGHYTIYNKVNNHINHNVIYLPSCFPMSYEEFKKINVGLNNIILSEDQFDKLIQLLQLEEKTKFSVTKM